MSQPEGNFTKGVHSHLPVKLYRMKNHNAYIGGPADVWYSGKKADIWVEYKFEILPKRDSTIIPIDLSALQVEWLAGRYKEGRNVFVIVGCKEGGVIFEKLGWLNPLTRDQFLPYIKSRKEIADWILQQTGGPP